MNRSQTVASIAILIVAMTGGVGGTGANANEYVVAGAVNRIADRCAAQFGPGFFDGGNGYCARVNNHTRVYVAPRTVGMNSWSGGASSNAAVTTTDSTSIMPAMPTQRFRVRGDLNSYGMFR